MDAVTPVDLPVRVPLATEPMGVLASLRAARRNVLEIIPELATRQPMVSGKTAIRWHMVMDPGAARRVLKERLDDYPKSDVTKNILEPAIGQSLFIAEGAHWRWQRRAAAPVFGTRNVNSLAPIMARAAEASVARLDAQSGRAADLFQEMLATTFEVIADVTFSEGSSVDRDAVHRAIEEYIAKSARTSLLDVLGVPTWVPRPSRLFPPQGIKRTRQMADQAIEARRAQGAKSPPDLLDMMMAGMDPETKRSMNTEELRDNLLTFIVAGHETTALTLAWALYLLAFDEAAQTRLRAEAQAVLGGRIAAAGDVPRLTFTEQVIKEALRLYPPAAFLSRTARAADTLCGREVRPGDTVMLPVYALHRNHLLWPDPDRFDPDRFAPGTSHDRYAWLPFGDGPRICIGASFAMTEATIILATLVSRFRFERIPGRDPQPVLILTLRPEGGVWLKVSPA
ncbi:MAG TPA: cytochrome P450 [Rhodobacteraceae bacterium]|jgi:cytochrome P450|nr:cytochrome P450 [Paracoccaceae bacterium]HBG98846.1 cytochrome P450 [Paracoccaceae bacterium]